MTYFSCYLYWLVETQLFVEECTFYITLAMSLCTSCNRLWDNIHPLLSTHDVTEGAAVDRQAETWFGVC